MESIVIFGATSGIARAVGEEFLKNGETLILVGRSEEALHSVSRDLEVRSGRKAPCFVWDLVDFPNHASRFAALRALCAQDGIKGVFMAAGVMFTQEEAEADPAKTRLTFDVNLTGTADVLNLFADHFGERRAGFISCVSSVAGDRGRQSNFTYGASKAGLTAYLQGLRNRLHGAGILVQTVKPGFVRTAMTAHMHSLLMASPRKVAKDIVRAIRCKRDVLYTPFFWRYIMLIIKAIPEPIFKRLKL